MTFHNAGVANAAPIQDWRTPPRIFRPLLEEFAFGTDLFADDENALLPNYFTARRSAFDFTGSSTAPAFGNPEYAKGFIKRAVDWAIDAVRVRKQFPKIVLLVPLTVPVGWGGRVFRECEVQIYEGRIPFIKPRIDGKPKSGNNAGSMLVIINSAEDDFRGVSAIRSATTGLVTVDYREAT